MASQIEGKCSCGLCIWPTGYGRPFWTYNWDYCPRCGYALGDDGIARRTVVLPEKPIEVWLATDTRMIMHCHGTNVFTEEPEIDEAGFFRSIRQKWWSHKPGGQKRFPLPGEKVRCHLIPAGEPESCGE